MVNRSDETLSRINDFHRRFSGKGYQNEGGEKDGTSTGTKATIN